MKIQWPLRIEMWAWPHVKVCRPQELRIRDQRGTTRVLVSGLSSEDKPARIDRAGTFLFAFGPNVASPGQVSPCL